MACPHDVNCAVTLVIGPEGGFIPFEIELLEKNGFQAVTLGPRILRVENAIPALAGRLF
jgi:RsmE family RNA methyltransferase